MDHRKLLVIILSVTLFSALVLGISLLALYPAGDRAQEGVQTADSRRVFDPIEYVRSSDGPLGIIEDEDSEDDGDLIIVYGSRQDDPEPAETARETDAPPAEPEPEPEPRVAEDPAPQPSAPQPEARQQPQPQQPRQTTPRQEPPAATPPAPATATPQPSPRTAAAVQTTGREYWIQVVSSPNRDTVERARERLEERSLGSVIFPIDIEGTRFYRLRVGPYPDRQEADKFLVWIRDLPGFAESYVSVVFRA